MLLTLILGAHEPHAHAATGFDVEIFKPAPSAERLWSTPFPAIPAPLQPSGALVVHRSAAPLVAHATTDSRDVISARDTVEFLGSVAILQWAELGLAVPFVVHQNGSGLPPFTPNPMDASTVGDARFSSTILLASPNGWGVALRPEISLPSGDRALLLGEGAATVRPAVLIGQEHLRWRWALELGAVLRRTATFASLSRGNSGEARLGGSYALGPAELIAETYGYSTLAAEPGGQKLSPFEALTGVRLTLGRHLRVGIAFAAGVTDDPGAARWRATASLSWITSRRDVDGDGISDLDDGCPQQGEDQDGFADHDGCPDPDNDEDGVPDISDQCPNPSGEGITAGVREDRDGFMDDDGCPDPDNDGDGIADGEDRCANQAEDRDGHEDKDGCPDPDNDSDGVIDINDSCAEQPEDRDGFQDDDGCPDEDNDGDGFNDATDACPNQAEDKDGFNDDDGCPEADNDGDGLEDTDDRCPNEAEDKDGVSDDDGCPEFAVGSGWQRVGTEWLPPRPIAFEPGQRLLSREGAALLAAIADALAAQNATIRISVRVKENQALAQQRAIAVLRVLVEAGVPPERMVADGAADPRPGMQIRVEDSP